MTVTSLKKSPEAATHPLIGYGLLTCSLDEEYTEIIHWQGTIKDVIATNAPIGDIAIVDWYSFGDGEYTHTTGLDLATLAAPHRGTIEAAPGMRYIKMFRTSDMRNAYYEEAARNSRAIK